MRAVTRRAVCSCLLQQPGTQQFAIRFRSGGEIGWSRDGFRAWTEGGYWRSCGRNRIEEAKGNG
ncbi:hypothetical protein [Rehaibacterium terrae]|uniref:Uncharacterized protein n=1 Tax=Rehaibacterium terrae TaxID=1341696 RepID=A0A7W8DF93_9GAMM|nr:hypothetical protein [Rehaibacterium terrae]MBB5016039.1 hypothetical protein [Rehaibacterium terrae]